MVKLIAVNDIKTLTNTQGQLNSTKFQTLVYQMQAQKIHLIIMSSDSYAHLLSLFNSIHGSFSFICENGAQVVNQGVVIKSHLLDYPTCKKLLDYVIKPGDMRGAKIILSGKNNAYTELKPNNQYFKTQKNYYGNLETVSDITSVFDGIYRIHLEWDHHDNDFMRKQMINAQFPALQAISNIHGGIDVLSKDASRLDGINTLKTALKIPRGETAIFSADDNDQLMFNLVAQGQSTADTSDDSIDQISKFLK